MRKIYTLSSALLLTACATSQPQQELQGEYVEGYQEACAEFPLAEICAPAQRLEWFLVEQDQIPEK